jgi:hypothetical protein
MAGQGKQEECLYGGGTLEEWVSKDNGRSWQQEREIIPEPRLIYNNPKPVVNIRGEVQPEWLLCYGWEGPEGVWMMAEGKPNRGKAFLLYKGEPIGNNNIND